MIWTVENVVSRVKAEILADVRGGLVPATAASFVELGIEDGEKKSCPGVYKRAES